jgi:hypothetical protein
MISNFSLLTVGKLLVLASLLAGLVGVHDVTVLSQTNTDNELFTDSPIAGTLSISGRPEIIRTRFVMVNISALGGIKGVSPQDTLILNLFPDAVFTARLRHIEWAPGGYVWIGRIEEKQLSDVLLSVVGDIVMGSIIMPGAVYSIEYAGGEYGGKKVHAIHEINQGAFPPDEGHAGPVIPPENSSTAPLINKPTGTATSPKSAMQASGQSTLNTSAPDTDAFIDVMVVYTPAARAAAGGTTAMQAHVNLMISQTNTAYANSNITTRLRLVRTDEVGYTESGDMDLDLNRITNCSDGFMDIVCTWRNTYSADLVALIVENGQYCGIAWLNDSSADAPRGFSVTLRTCATANITFAHEVGHNQGMCHDWYVDGPGCEVFGWATYSYGYVDDDLGDRWRTIMAYNTRCSDQGFNCTRILYFSNPSVLYSGGNPNQPTGVNPGTNTSCLVGQIPTTECDAHNARTLNESDIVIANFRQTNDNFANAQVISGNSGTVTGSNVWATKEPGEPNHAGNAGGASVWYRWTPSTSGSATIDTIGSNFDTLLAVYIGSAVNSLTLIASNDDIGGGNLQSRVTFSATAGTTYSIAVDGYGGATGNITLNWSLTTTTNRILTVAGAGTGNGTVTATGISCTITAGSTSGDCSESYPDGTSVTLTATAASGSTFAGWTNCDAPSGNQCTMTMNANKTVTATFNVVMRTLTVTGAGTGNGTVTATGISCTITAGSTSGDCSESYPDGTSVTLTATAASGSTFAGWTNCDAPSGNQCTMTMNANKTVTATFNVVMRTLTVTGAGTGNGTVTATGISCTITAGSTSGDCSESYPDGTSVTLTATAASGSTFAGWTNCDAPSGNQCTMTMNANKTVTATFNVVMRTLTVTGAGTGNGTVTATGISCTITAGSTSGDCSESYPDGTSVTLTATAASGSTFAGWTNCDAPSGNQCTMTMNANKTVTATFNVVMRTLTVAGAGTGNGTVTATGISCTITAGSTSGDCSESYPDGTSVTLTATAASGSTFAGWTNCDAPSGNQCTMTMNANKTVTATFNILGPANDNFANAQDISGDSGNITGSNVGATKEPCEPNHHNIPGGASVWYRWTAPIGGNATFDTFGSNFDTVLAVYTGDNLCSLTYIASSDDDPLGGLQSRVSFNAVAGTTYHIAVDGFGGFSSSGVERAFGDKISTAAVAMGDIVLNWSVVEAQADEDFETGNLSKFPWETGGRDRWIVTNAASHSGNYSARAPLSLRDGRQAYLQVTLLVETGMISFWRKVSSEQNRDFLKFYIDGVLQGQWSGEVDWEQVSFPVTAGEHTFKWVYTKDRSRSGGQDTAWIDDIDFPPLHPCYGVTISSSPASVTYRPTPTRPDRKTIRVTVTNQSGAPQTVIDIVKQPDEPFEIVSISPPLPQMIADGARQTFSVLTERAAGSGRATARRPYFEITLSCGMLTLASEPSLLMPLQPNDVQVKLQGNHLQVEAQGANIATVRLQLYDLLGRLILDQEGRGNTMVLPAKTAQDTPLANGVYLYVVRVRGFDDREYVSEVRKLVIMR